MLSAKITRVIISRKFVDRPQQAHARRTNNQVTHFSRTTHPAPLSPVARCCKAGAYNQCKGARTSWPCGPLPETAIAPFASGYNKQPQRHANSSCCPPERPADRVQRKHLLPTQVTKQSSRGSLCQNLNPAAHRCSTPSTPGTPALWCISTPSTHRAGG